MTLERFQKLVDAWGGELAAWPEAERDRAERLLASDPRARSTLETAQRLDSLIRRGLSSERIHEAEASEAVDRVLARLAAGRLPGQQGRGPARAARALRGLAGEAAGFGLRPFRAWLGAFACAGALGIAIGVLVPEPLISLEPGRHANFAEAEPDAFVFYDDQDAGAAL